MDILGVFKPYQKVLWEIKLEKLFFPFLKATKLVHKNATSIKDLSANINCEQIDESWFLK